MTYARRYLLSSNSTSTTVSQVKSTAADPPEAVAAAESDFVVILAALLCALICGVGLLAVARCAWLRRGAGGIRRGGFPSANKGLKKKVLQSLPKYTYDSASAAENGKATSSPGAAADCAICLSEYVDGDEIRVLPQCGHGFHVQCIDTWLGSHSSCPSCRQILAVPRCRKCGEFPAVGSGNPSGGGGGGGGGPGGGGEGQTEVKSRHDSIATASTSSTFLP